MIAFLSALREERVAVRDSWGVSPAGSLQGLELELGDGAVHLCTGMGPERVARGVEILQRVYRPSCFVLSGFSVGLWPELKVGDLLCDERSSQSLTAALSEHEEISVARMANCGFLLTSAQKRAFAEKFPAAPAADMETEAFLRAVPESVSALVLRVVSDDVQTDLPLDLSVLVDEGGFPDQRGIALALARRPFALPGLLRLAGDAQMATKRLTGALRSVRNLLS